MTFVSLIWKTLLALIGAGCIIVAAFALVILLIAVAKAIKKEVRDDDSENLP